MSFEEDIDIDLYGQSAQYQIDQTINNQANAAAVTGDKTQMPTTNINPTVADTKPPIVWKVNDTIAGGSPGTYNIYNALMNNNQNQYTFHSDLVQSYANKWQQNFQYILGPANPALRSCVIGRGKLSERDFKRGGGY